MENMSNERIDKPHAVIFDMDGLLLDSEIVNFESFKKAWAAFQCIDQTYLFFSALGRNHNGALDVLTKELGSKNKAQDFEKYRPMKP